MIFEYINKNAQVVIFEGEEVMAKADIVVKDIISQIGKVKGDFEAEKSLMLKPC